MNNPDDPADRIHQRAQNLQRARQRKNASPLHGLAAFGVIGWSVAVPTVAGALLGRWLNTVAPQNFSWTLALILGGLVLGGIHAWNWISASQQAAEKEHYGDEPHDD